jgi:rRNA-processing protein FCF1
MKTRVFRDIQKMIFDIEAGRGDIQATILNLDAASISKARELLIKYADRYNHGSQDALIVASVVIARDNKGLDLTVVTSDKGMKAVLRDEGVPFLDPGVL